MIHQFVLNWRSPEAVSIKFHWCFIWSPDSRIPACSWFYKFIQSLIISWLKDLIAVVILLLSCDELAIELWYTWGFKNPQRKKSSVVRSGDLANHPAGTYLGIHELGSISPRRELNVREILGKAPFCSKSNSAGIVELLTGLKCSTFNNYWLLWLFHY